MGKQNPPKSNHHKTDNEIQKLTNQIAHLESENFTLKNLIDTLPGDIYWKDMSGVWMGLNTRCAESLQRMGFIKNGMKSEEIGKTDYQIFNTITADG